MRHSKRLKAKRTTEKNDDDSCALWCLCREPEDSCFMIQWDIQGSNCKVWYHGDCVGVSESQGKHMEHYAIDFICPFCSTDISDNARGAASSSMTTLPPYTELRAASFFWNDSIEGTVFVKKFPLLMMRLFIGVAICDRICEKGSSTHIRSTNFHDL